MVRVLGVTLGRVGTFSFGDERLRRALEFGSLRTGDRFVWGAEEDRVLCDWAWDGRVLRWCWRANRLLPLR
jgi:hypothetical protein